MPGNSAWLVQGVRTQLAPAPKGAFLTEHSLGKLHIEAALTLADVWLQASFGSGAMSGAVASAQPVNAVLGDLRSSLGLGTPIQRTQLARSQSAAHAWLLRPGQQPQGSLPAVWAPELARANSLQATFAEAQASLLQAQAQAKGLAGVPPRVGGSKRDFASISTLGTNDSVASHQTVVRKAASPSQVRLLL